MRSNCTALLAQAEHALESQQQKSLSLQNMIDDLGTLSRINSPPRCPNLGS